MTLKQAWDDKLTLKCWPLRVWKMARWRRWQVVLEWWREFFGVVPDSPALYGNAAPQAGHWSWRFFPEQEWILWRKRKKTYIYALPERHPDLSAPSASSDLNGGFADYYNPSHQYCNLQFTCYSELVPVIALFDYRSWFPCRGWAHQTLRVILVRAPRNVLKFPCTWIGTTTGQWVILTRDRTVLVGCCGSFVTACVVTFTAITEGAVCKEMIQSEKCTENQYVLLTCDLSAWRLGAMGFSGCGGNVYCCLGGGGGSKRSALVLSPLGLFRAFSEVVRWDFVRRLS